MPHLKVGAQKWTATAEQLTNELTLAIGTLKPTFQLKKKRHKGQFKQFTYQTHPTQHTYWKLIK